MTVNSPPASHLPRHTIAALAAMVLSACSFSPLAHRVKVGEEPVVVFVGEGRDGHTDLFATTTNGGAVTQFTFTALAESDPRLSPDGIRVAFLRNRTIAPDAPRDVVVMNLLTGSETSLPLPDSAGAPSALAWSDDGSALYIATSSGIWRAASPPAPPAIAQMAPTERSRADTALQLWLGSPRFTRVISCATTGVCVIGPRGDTAALAPDGHDAMRWGSDSVAWFEGDAIVVRSLGPGHERRFDWKDGPTHPRDGSVALPVQPAN